MSFLLLEAPDCDPRKETHSATHEEVSELKKVVEGGSFWSVLGQICDPVCILHGEGLNILKPVTENLIEPQAGILEFDNEQQQVKRDPEISHAGPECACEEVQEVLTQSLEDGLECKLASPACFPPECSTVHPHQLEKELLELSLQDAKVDESVSCSEGDILKLALSPASSLTFEGKCEGLFLSPGLADEVPLSIKGDVDLTKLKSSLRGGHEKAGLGPRLKLHVTWAPDVYDPPYTSTSHTSNQSHRRHHHPRSEHKSRHKGKGSNHSDSRKKSQKKILRKSKHNSESFLSAPDLVSSRGIRSNTLMLNEYVAPLQDLTRKTGNLSALILPPKGCFLNPVLPFGEMDRAMFEMMEGYRLRHSQARELCL